MTPVGWLNFLILQWFGVRLAYIRDWKRPVGLLVGVVPLTGWRADHQKCVYMWWWG